jgi:hypothetical protein
MVEAMIAGSAHLVFVFFKAFQQRNVAFLHYWWVMPVSFFMSGTEVLVLSLVAVRAVQVEHLLEMAPFVFTLGLGGGIGALGAMWTHDKFLGKK